MHIGIVAILVLGALVSAIVHAMGKCPLWVSVILIVLAVGIGVLGK